MFSISKGNNFFPVTAMVGHGGSWLFSKLLFLQHHLNRLSQAKPTFRPRPISGNIQFPIYLNRFLISVNHLVISANQRIRGYHGKIEISEIELDISEIELEI